jgi:hypothetical protein
MLYDENTSVRHARTFNGIREVLPDCLPRSGGWSDDEGERAIRLAVGGSGEAIIFGKIVTSNILSTISDLVTGIPVKDIAERFLRTVKRIRTVLSPSGIYEVLDYESTLEIKDIEGKEAYFYKREKVRYLQNNIIAYQDQAWGDGEILQNYYCSPGKAVDFSRPGLKTIILIAIQNIRHFGDLDEYLIAWGMTNCFLRPREQWETSIDHPTNRLRLNLVFPFKRPPYQVSLIEETNHRSTLIDSHQLNRVADGRWMVHTEIDKPRLNERYILEWDW